MRVLCLDMGKRRIGVARGETGVGIATPVATIYRRSWQHDGAAVRRLLAAHEAEALVIGLPVSLDGALHHQGKRVRAEGERLEALLDVPVVFWDERFSTVIAAERLRESPTGARRKPSIDAAAAAVILESYFAALSEGEPSLSAGGESGHGAEGRG